jgi:hypothetical protein
MLSVIDRRCLVIVLHQRGKIVRLGEQSIHVLQLQTLGLRIEEVDAGYPAGVEYGEDDICPPADIFDGSCYA